MCKQIIIYMNNKSLIKKSFKNENIDNYDYYYKTFANISNFCLSGWYFVKWIKTNESIYSLIIYASEARENNTESLM